MIPATAADWDEEYLDLILAVAVVPSLDAAIAHVNRHGSHHSDVIVAEDPRYARLLMGLSISRAAITGRAIEMTETWAALLRHVQGRAHAETKHAIDVWIRRWRKAGGDKG